MHPRGCPAADDLVAPSWEKPLTRAFTIADDLAGMTLGRGTGLMLQFGHRDSRDIDLFLPDPQLPGCVSAVVSDMQAWLSGPTYRGEGSLYLKADLDGPG